MTAFSAPNLVAADQASRQIVAPRPLRLRGGSAVPSARPRRQTSSEPTASKPLDSSHEPLVSGATRPRRAQVTGEGWRRPVARSLGNTSLRCRPPSVDPRFARRLAPFNKHVTNRLTLPLAPRLPWLGVVAHVGRRSGRTYRTPVNVFSNGWIRVRTDVRPASAMGPERPPSEAVRAHDPRQDLPGDQSGDLPRRDSARRRARRKANAETRRAQRIHAHGRCRPQTDDSSTAT